MIRFVLTEKKQTFFLGFFLNLLCPFLHSHFYFLFFFFNIIFSLQDFTKEEHNKRERERKSKIFLIKRKEKRKSKSLMAPMTNWLTFSLSPMDMLRSSDQSQFVSYDASSAASSSPYLLDNFYGKNSNFLHLFLVLYW